MERAVAQTCVYGCEKHSSPAPTQINALLSGEIQYCSHDCKVCKEQAFCWIFLYVQIIVNRNAVAFVYIVASLFVRYF